MDVENLAPHRDSILAPFSQQRVAIPTELSRPTYARLKGEAIPVQVWTGPEGPRRLRLQDFMTEHESDKVVSPTHRPPLSPRKYSWYSFMLGSRDSSVGIATRYGLEGPRIESRWGETFHTYLDQLRGPPNLMYIGYRLSPGSKGGRCVMLTTPLLVPRLRKS
jgi:hypothetical protein